jgi:replicative DNA helicase
MNSGFPFEGDGETVSITEALARTLDEIERRGRGPNLGSFVSSGYPNLDMAAGGLPCEALTLISGEAKVGKTALALAIARHSAVPGNGEVLYVAGAEQIELLTLRLLSHEARVSIRDLQRGRLRPSSWSDVAAAVKLISDLPIRFLENGTSSIDQICSTAALIDHHSHLRSVFIDPVSSLQGWSDDPFHRSSVLTGLRCLATQVGVPIVLCQSRSSNEMQGDPGPELELSISRGGELNIQCAEPRVCIEVLRRHHQPKSVLMYWDAKHAWISQPVLTGHKADHGSV